MKEISPNKISPEIMAKILREHKEMVALITDFPEKEAQLTDWKIKRNELLEKIQKR